jgi:hypothetical protein
MKTERIDIALAGIFALLLSLPVNAGEKVTGVHKDFRMISDATAIVPGQPDHLLKRVTYVFNSTTSNPKLGDFSSTFVQQQDIIAKDVTFIGYGEDHFPNGDVTYVTIEGSGIMTPSATGPFDIVEQGKFIWTGGTGEHDIKGGGTFTCNLKVPPMPAEQVIGECTIEGGANFPAT